MSWHPLQLESESSHPIPLYRWDRPSSARAVVHITHGMAEHSQRYGALAKQLQAEGYQVVAHDHRGHGTCASPHQGHFADDQGWSLVCEDLRRVHRWVAQEFCGLPLYLLGHSMGSYISLGYLMRDPEPLAGVILSGSNYGSPTLYRIARGVARIERWRLGARTPSLLMDRLGFGSFNRAFKPNRTPFDWLSRDPEQVDRYLADPLCGFPCSSQLWIDLLGGLLEISSPMRLTQVPNLPLHIIGGEEDPVSAPRGLHDLYRALKQPPREQVSIKLYPGARHELFNEINRDEVVSELLDWLSSTPTLSAS
ncbi:alpha/beta hydrolase [Aestuariirhabdus litorea]|uniref:Lysophospholipase n=1 Tax=Aestuariirhabdus litorea TaxID=2528527 RepID=A0A3P3VPZ0_9GAMM|nr:alpha/beta hydrolase [Aestuariirhabdus litorea]RRJ84842.1 lysophospholipase [Aestuariirhabdus litorea]RWW98068.1 alpha/beta fold hydrolase [Endozoicomonadaceae bacterium GTF-13]